MFKLTKLDMEQNKTMQQNGPRPDKVFSKMLRAGSKTYFFDVMKASNGNNYLTVTESHKDKTGQQVRNRIMLFGDHMAEFSGTLSEAAGYLR